MTSHMPERAARLIYGGWVDYPLDAALLAAVNIDLNDPQAHASLRPHAAPTARAVLLPTDTVPSAHKEMQIRLKRVQEHPARDQTAI